MPSNPEVRIKEGERVNFHVDATGHPFYIKTTNTTGTGDLVSGVSNNGAVDGTVTWTPPGGSAGTYYYKVSLIYDGQYESPLHIGGAIPKTITLADDADPYKYIKLSLALPLVNICLICCVLFSANKEPKLVSIVLFFTPLT